MLRGKIPHFRLTSVAQKLLCLSSLLFKLPIVVIQKFCYHGNGRRTSLYLRLMRKIACSRLFALDSAHVKCDV